MQQRSPVTIVLLGFVTCGIYHLIWMHQVGEEMRARGAEVPPTWHIIIPILNFLWMWKWAQAAEKVTNGALQGCTNHPECSGSWVIEEGI